MIHSVDYEVSSILKTVLLQVCMQFQLINLVIKVSICEGAELTLCLQYET